MYSTRAMRVHARQKVYPHIAKCHLHSAAILSRLRRHAEAVRCLGQVLHIVESGDLNDGGDAPHKLCLVAVCYHNIAVEQLLLHHVEEAVVSAQNARRLARLCLSYSNRWLDKFENTHRCCAEALAARADAEVLSRRLEDELAEANREIVFLQDHSNDEPHTRIVTIDVDRETPPGAPAPNAQGQPPQDTGGPLGIGWSCF